MGVGSFIVKIKRLPDGNMSAMVVSLTRMLIREYSWTNQKATNVDNIFSAYGQPLPKGKQVLNITNWEFC